MISIFLAAIVISVAGSTSIWTDGPYTWAGPKECLSAGFLLAPGNPVNDQGEWIAGLHCPNAGPDLSGCQEWLGSAPPIGACDTAPGSQPNPPSGVTVVNAISGTN